MIKLTYAELNKEYTIKKINIDDAKVKSYLKDLGIICGHIIIPLKKILSNVIIEVKNTRYVMNYVLADNIYVEILNEEF